MGELITVDKAFLFTLKEEIRLEGFIEGIFFERPGGRERRRTQVRTGIGIDLDGLSWSIKVPEFNSDQNRLTLRASGMNEIILIRHCCDNLCWVEEEICGKNLMRPGCKQECLIKSKEVGVGCVWLDKHRNRRVRLEIRNLR